MTRAAMLLIAAHSSPLFGLAGIAEAALAMAYGLLRWGLFFVIIPVLLGWYLKSRTASGIALALVCLLGLLFSPWGAFLPMKSDDPEVREARSMFVVLALLWVMALATAAAAAVRAFLSPREPLGPRQEAWRKAIPVHVSLVGISCILWIALLRVSGAFPVEAVIAMVLVHALALDVGVLIPRRTLLTCVGVFLVAFLLTGWCGIKAIRTEAKPKVQEAAQPHVTVYDRFRDNLCCPIPASVAHMRFVPLEETIRPDLMFRFDIAPGDLDTLLEKLRLERVDPKIMLNPKDFFQYPYYVPLDGKYQLYQGKDRWGDIVTIKTNEAHSHAIFRSENLAFYKNGQWEAGNLDLIRWEQEALAGMKKQYEAEHRGGVTRE